MIIDLRLETPSNKEMKAGSFLPGEMIYGRLREYTSGEINAGVFLRIWDGLVLLDNPSFVWTFKEKNEVVFEPGWKKVVGKLTVTPAE